MTRFFAMFELTKKKLNFRFNNNDEEGEEENEIGVFVKH